MRVDNIFKPDNSVYNFGNKLLYVIIVNFLFIITSIPIITIGASSAAMYNVMIKVSEDRGISIFKEYFNTFVKKFFVSTLVEVILIIVGFILYIDVAYFAIQGTVVGNIAVGITVAITVLYLAFAILVFAVIAKYDKSFKEVIKTTVYILGRFTGWCIIATVITTVLVGGFFYTTLIGIPMFFYMIIMIFALNTLILSYIFDRIMTLYIKE